MLTGEGDIGEDLILASEREIEFVAQRWLTAAALHKPAPARGACIRSYTPDVSRDAQLSF